VEEIRGRVEVLMVAMQADQKDNPVTEVADNTQLEVVLNWQVERPV